ncbi:ABC transporter permease [Gemmatimonas sp.]|uniref:ABC transporter permease n=1 Tax=Gemmatimonas sp. TaxID=1962908 RepID=UPI003982F364
MTARVQRVRAISGLTLTACVIVTVVAVASLLAPWLAPHDPAAQLDVVRLKNAAPSWSHPLGTDPYSRDLLSRALFGARTSLIIGLVGAGIAATIALAWGLLAGFVRRQIGDRMMSVLDAFRAVPRKVVLLAAVMVVPHASAMMLAVLLGVTSWTALSQVLCVQVRSLRTRDFVTAARSIGATPTRLMLRHIGPQLIGSMTAASALLLADMLAVEAGLSFLGLGVRAPHASWGTMLQDGVPYLASAWWIAATPCVLLVLTVLSIARIADAVHASSAAKAPAA